MGLRRNALPQKVIERQPFVIIFRMEEESSKGGEVTINLSIRTRAPEWFIIKISGLIIILDHRGAVFRFLIWTQPQIPNLPSHRSPLKWNTRKRLTTLCRPDQHRHHRGSTVTTTTTPSTRTIHFPATIITNTRILLV